MSKFTTCPHCEQQTLETLASGYIHCLNSECGGWYATLPPEEYNALTAAQLTDRLAARTRTAEVIHAKSTQEMAAIYERIQERIASRKIGEKLFG